jgi:hypothetical protein
MHVLRQEAAAPSPEPAQGKWLDGAAIDGHRWVDPSDAAAVEAWGTAPRHAQPAAFDAQRASQLPPEQPPAARPASGAHQLLACMRSLLICACMCCISIAHTVSSSPASHLA